MEFFIALVFSTLVVDTSAALDDCLENQLQPLQTIESRFSMMFPNHISDEVLSSLVYIKNETHHLCDGAIINDMQALFTSDCFYDYVKEDENREYPNYSVVVRGAIMVDVKSNFIDIVQHDIGSDVYNDLDIEPFAVVTFTEPVPDVKRITWPSTEVKEKSDAVVGGWDKNGKFKMYYVPVAETHYHVYTPPATDGFRGGYVFQKHKLIGLFYEIRQFSEPIELEMNERETSYYQVSCKIGICRNKMRHAVELSQKVLRGMSHRNTHNEPAFFTESSSHNLDTNSD